MNRKLLMMGAFEKATTEYLNKLQLIWETYRDCFTEAVASDHFDEAGPSMIKLADSAIYVAILREIGLVALAVTTSFNINFLRKPKADKNILGQCKLLELGKSLAIGDSEDDNKPVAHAVGSYSIPAKVS